MLPVISAILIALGTTVTTLLSPLLGLIFITAMGGKWLVDKFEKRYILITAMLVIPATFYYGSIITKWDFVNIVFGVVLIAIVHFYVLLKTFSYRLAICSSALMATGFAVIRYFVFNDYYSNLIDESFNQSFILLEKLWQNNAESTKLLATLKTASASIKQNLINYQVALWVVPSTIGIAIGSMVLSKISNLKWFFIIFKIPYKVVWALIPFLAFTAFGKPGYLNLVVYNGLAIFSSLYLLQGFAIIGFYWRIWFAKSRLFSIIFIVAIILNPYLLPLITVIGLLDTWFNFRKLREEPNENNSN